MGEIIQFPNIAKRNLTASGRFLLTAIKQERAAEDAAKKQKALRRPTTAQSMLAKRELDFIFGGENAAEAEALYRQGLDDVVCSRRATEQRVVSVMFHDDFTAWNQTVVAAGGYTEAALFYIHVENLTSTAAALHNRAPSINQARFDRLK